VQHRQRGAAVRRRSVAHHGHECVGAEAAEAVRVDRAARLHVDAFILTHLRQRQEQHVAAVEAQAQVACGEA
jgi:hypothetical protein